MDLGTFPWHRRTLHQLPEQYVCITDNGGLLRAQLPFGDPVWLFGSHDAYRRLTTHLAVSADHSHPQYPALSSIKRRRTADGERPVLAYSGLDGGEHAHHRRLVDRSFTERQVAGLGEALGAVVDCELDAALGDTQPVDLAGGISIRLAVRCILLFLGVPLVSRAALGGVLAGLASPELTLHRREVLGHRLRAGVAAACAAEPGRQGSAWETLRHAYGPGPVFTEMTASLLIAGTETVARAICSGMLVVRGSSEAVDRLDDSSADTGKTVDEILRLCGVADFVSMRVAVADFEMMGHRISRGDALVGLSALADRDASVFTSPARLDFRRAPRTVNAFGHGVHRCLGKHLARAVLGHTWKGLARRGALHRPLTVRWPDSGPRPLLYGPSVLTLA